MTPQGSSTALNSNILHLAVNSAGTEAGVAIVTANKGRLTVSWGLNQDQLQSQEVTPFSVSPKDGDTTWQYSSPDQGYYYFTIRDLEPGKTYALQVVSEDSQGNKAQADRRSFTTSPQIETTTLTLEDGRTTYYDLIRPSAFREDQNYKLVILLHGSGFTATDYSHNAIYRALADKFDIAFLAIQSPLASSQMPMRLTAEQLTDWGFYPFFNSGLRTPHHVWSPDYRIPGSFSDTALEEAILKVWWQHPNLKAYKPILLSHSGSGVRTKEQLIYQSERYSGFIFNGSRLRYDPEAFDAAPPERRGLYANWLDPVQNLDRISSRIPIYITGEDAGHWWDPKEGRNTEPVIRDLLAFGEALRARGHEVRSQLAPGYHHVDLAGEVMGDALSFFAGSWQKNAGYDILTQEFANPEFFDHSGEEAPDFWRSTGLRSRSGLDESVTLSSSDPTLKLRVMISRAVPLAPGRKYELRARIEAAQTSSGPPAILELELKTSTFGLSRLVQAPEAFGQDQIITFSPQDEEAYGAVRIRLKSDFVGSVRVSGLALQEVGQ